ncbi:MAG: GTPase [Microthrixaceae bacterium]
MSARNDHDPTPPQDSTSSRRQRRSSARAADELAARLEILSQVVALADDRLDPTAAEHARHALEAARGRLGHGTTHTVVALAGATGSGKSSTFNAILGEDLAPVGVRRPTTSEPRAAVVGGGAEGLLDWLEIPRRHLVGDAGDELAGLVLVDLPDHDSTAREHRAEVDRLVEVVDAFIWVVDPQKYADAALHEGYLRRFAGHAGVTLVALNQIDLLAEGDRTATLEHLSRLLAEDGLVGVRVLPTSTATGAGIEALRRELAARVAERRALVTRLDADLDWVAAELAVAVGDTEPGPIPQDSARRLTDSLAAAAGVEVVADAAGAAHRRRSAQVAGWPPVRWVGRLRPDPLRRLGLDKVRATTRPNARDDAASAASTGVDTVTVARTSRAAPGAVAEAGIDEAVRSLVDRSASGLPDSWRRRLGEVAGQRRDELPDALDRAVGSVELPTQRPAWWSPASAAQWLFTAVMVVGVLWLVAIGAVAWLGLPDLPAPTVGVVPWPTLLAVGGAAAGVLAAIVAGWLARLGGRRRSAQARRLLLDSTATVADQLVIMPVDAELAAMAELSRLARQLDR